MRGVGVGAVGATATGGATTGGVTEAALSEAALSEAALSVEPQPDARSKSVSECVRMATRMHHRGVGIPNSRD